MVNINAHGTAVSSSPLEMSENPISFQMFVCCFSPIPRPVNPIGRYDSWT